MPGVEWIMPDEIRGRLERGEALNIVDVREAEEVAEGMIPGARHIPLGELPVRLHEIERSGEIILVCRSGNRSGRAGEYLAELGVDGLKNMYGGMLAYGEP
ncbi:MAG: sulfurtransferase [Paenibacillaceae bacterium]|jgi:rhodanese-related sulfurtransferase|nr:sulfurtransferase [Paenibacillaceae bacterium]